jgi:hypothetical protein
MSVGVVDRFGSIPSLKTIVPPLQRRVCLFSMIGYILFVTIATYPMLFSDFRLYGY